jgi:Flp pilus assembly protein TadD
MGTSPLEALRQSAAARPGDALVWKMLAAVSDAAEKETALRKAVQLDPESSRELNDLAWLLTKSGRAKEALAFANRSLDLAPWNALAVDTLAEIASRLGKCPAAIVLIRRAQWQRRDDEGSRRRTAEIESRCK